MATSEHKIGHVVEVVTDKRELPDLLGRFYQENPNQKASVDQLGRMTGWYAFPGANAVRIIDTVRNHTESVVTGRRTARAVLPDMANDVRRLLPSA